MLSIIISIVISFYLSFCHSIHHYIILSIHPLLYLYVCLWLYTWRFNFKVLHFVAFCFLNSVLRTEVGFKSILKHSQSISRNTVVHVQNTMDFEYLTLNGAKIPWIFFMCFFSVTSGVKQEIIGWRERKGIEECYKNVRWILFFFLK